MDDPAPRWFKSSHSSHISDCLEVAFAGLRPDSWSKSSASHVSGNSCVEIRYAPAAARVRLRDSQARSGLVLGVATAEWRAFVRAVRG
ncbi:DUF397 domain-containing protein [Nocardiopsis sp. NRRL B-16309]|uniref:DUF397 domain-containing protein n=1 Tax=Nocardiopsis sp. NRRL B-16309 TaxID=1519494 RepID=UPI0006B003D7|nr:DUF397 domain-containing protein [Nocardiopsis sp. NRRL B-16309]KOX22242.1 hypothetical protein ADL05_04555 [Nocardiopsis sp. NRRL B-16309]